MTRIRTVALTTVCLLAVTVTAVSAPPAKVKPAPANCPACAMGMTAEKVFSRLDADGDKKVTVKEFMRSPGMRDEAEARAAVGRIDADADGSLSWTELAKAYKERHARCPKVDPAKAGGQGRGNRSRFAMVFMMQNDKNDDGAVDKSEFRGSDARFDQMDKNANGKLEAGELADLHARRMNDPKSMRERLASGDLPRRPPGKRPGGDGGTKGPPKGKGKPKGRKCPADKIEIGGHDIAEILVMLGAKRELGASDDQLRAYSSHFDRSDPNKDGKHTRAEYVDGGSFMTPQARAGIFGATDNNGDDIATRVEYVLNRIITDEAKAIVQRTDADKNGKVTRGEFVKGSPIKNKTLAGAVYDALDASGDGVITVPEYLRVWGVWARPNYKAQEAALAGRLAKLGKGGKPTAGPKGGKPDKGPKPAGGPPGVEQIFKVMDRDKDGKLTRAEFRGPAHVFTAADKDKDGVVTRGEMEAFRRRTGGSGRKPDGKGPPTGGPKPPAGGEAGVEALFKLADRDGDGKLSKGELRRLVGAGDADGDGMLSLKELLELQRKGFKAKPKRER